MKKRMIVLMCLILFLFALFGCAKEAEESIPEGWVEYDLEKTEMKIALPPHYVAAERDGLLPSYADYERAGITEEDRAFYRDILSRKFDAKAIVFAAISPETADRGRIAMGISYGEAPESIRLRSFSVNQDNIDMFQEMLIEEVEKLEPEDTSIEIEENLLGIKHAFVVFNKIDPIRESLRRTQEYGTICRGRNIQIIFAISEEDANDAQLAEFDQIAYWLRME